MKSKIKKSAVSPTREENYPEWYQQIIKSADLAETSQVRGCMIIKPWGFAIWENIQKVLDKKIKDSGHVNAYFPLLVPLSLLQKEATHVEGFAKECAVVTHHRLKKDDQGKLVPDGHLDEPYVIRPTSETIIGQTYAKWVQSYRDLPILINQWANVMRWEMRPRIFLRTSEFLWQEGHTVHATEDEAKEETMKILDLYEDFSKNWIALPVIKGKKTPDERFPGAVDTFTIEAMMQDKKALQAGTSHFLGQNFAKASQIKFLDKSGNQKYAWTTSWGVTTRLIGGLIMTHSDDDGLVLPPKLAPTHVVLLPIYKTEEQKEQILEACQKIKLSLNDKIYHGNPLNCSIDDRDLRGGEKYWSQTKKGIPLRCEIGPRDIANDTLMVNRRDQDPRQKQAIKINEFIEQITKTLDNIQNSLYQKALNMRQENTKEIESLEDFEKYFKNSGGFALCYWSEKAIGHPLLEKLKVTPRCIPLEQNNERKPCIFTGEKESQQVIFARSY